MLMVTTLDSSSQLFLADNAENLNKLNLTGGESARGRLVGWSLVLLLLASCFGGWGKSSAACSRPRRPCRTAVVASQILQSQPNAGGMSQSNKTRRGLGDSVSDLSRDSLHIPRG